MFKINKTKNYIAFAEKMEKETGCTITIRVMEPDCSHIHYQFNDKHGLSLGVLCIQDGSASFAPFVTLDSAKDEQYINMYHFTQVDSFINLIKVFGNTFIYDEEN